eukprot:4383456-Lingulodinium_polyedra.AAC.1
MHSRHRGGNTNNQTLCNRALAMNGRRSHRRLRPQYKQYRKQRAPPLHMGAVGPSCWPANARWRT